MTTSKNIDRNVVTDFGRQWSKFDQSHVPADERRPLFEQYFSIFPWDRLPPNASGFDLGCGSGRWAMEVAPRVGHLHCIDPSEAIDVARHNLKDAANCSFHRAPVDAIPLDDESMDFGYSLGVLHHVPDTEQGIRDCVRKLKRGAPFLIYLYYAFDNQPAWFRLIWRLSEIPRRIVSSLPSPLKYAASQLIAVFVYWPLGRTATLMKRAGLSVHSFPLGAYWNRSFYAMRTDALDRFGTRLEQRFTRAQMQQMLENAGLEDIRFSAAIPFWTAVGFKK